MQDLCGGLVALCFSLIGLSVLRDLFFVLRTLGDQSRPIQGSLGLDGTSNISVSGLSSGADFAGQFLVAFSSTVIGAGIFAGQPYMCAVTKFPGDEVSEDCKDPDGQNSKVPRCPRFCVGCKDGEVLPYDHCKRPDPSIVEVKLLKNNAENNAKAGLIDGLGNLSKRHVYLNHNTEDQDYLSVSVKNTADFFRLFMDEPEKQVAYEGNINAGHAYPVPGDRPFTCGHGQVFGMVDMPVQNCKFDGPGHALKHIYKGIRTLRQPADADKEKTRWNEKVENTMRSEGNTSRPNHLDRELQGEEVSFEFRGLRWFDQKPFMGDKNEPMLADEGMIYVPKGCVSGNVPCDLHINFPGCGFATDAIFITLVHSLNLNEWAESNNIVMLYPRVDGDGETVDQKDGCWNVYGMTEDYATQGAAQMHAVKSMIDAATKGKLGDYAGKAVGYSRVGVFLFVGLMVVACCSMGLICRRQPPSSKRPTPD